MQRASQPRPRACRRTATANYAAFRVVYAGGARARSRKTSELQLFTSACAQVSAGNAVRSIGRTNEREKGEKVHTHTRADEVGGDGGGRTGAFACLRRAAGSAQLVVTNGGDRDGKSFGRAFRESALNETVEYLFCRRYGRNILGICFSRLRAAGRAEPAWPTRRRKMSRRHRGGRCGYGTYVPRSRGRRKSRGIATGSCRVRRIDRSIESADAHRFNRR